MSTEALRAVVNTNALITPEQFSSLKNSLGKEVAFHYQFVQIFSDEEPSITEENESKFQMEDFRYFTDPETNERYLAFFESKEEKFFPYFDSQNLFSDTTIIEARKLTDAVGNVLWNFDNRGSAIHFKVDDYRPEGRLTQIKEKAESAKLFLAKKAQGEYVDRVEEIQERANYESSIGNLPSHMADYYDNEVRVAHQTLRKSEEENK